MSKLGLIAILSVLICSFASSQRVTVQLSGKLIDWDDRWRPLLAAQHYDSIIFLCAHKIYPFDEEIRALAEAYAALGISDSAQYYVTWYVDKAINEGKNPFTIIDDYTLTPHLCRNKDFERMVKERYRSFYAKDGHKKWEPTLDILQLYYQWNINITQLEAALDRCKDEACIQESKAYADERQNALTHALVKIWERHGFITEYEGGPWVTHQHTLAQRITDTQVLRTSVLPVFTEAYEQGKIAASSYVSRLVAYRSQCTGVSVNDSAMNAYYNELCRRYQCDTTAVIIIINDTNKLLDTLH
jgi:hypothetical protein